MLDFFDDFILLTGTQNTYISINLKIHFTD